jgi:hypothetical protein
MAMPRFVKACPSAVGMSPRECRSNRFASRAASRSRSRRLAAGGNRRHQVALARGVGEAAGARARDGQADGDEVEAGEVVGRH